ncbi:MAG: hypothetical protein Kilf2KO_33680 [Rhodospirillales bacterium]
MSQPYRLYGDYWNRAVGPMMVMDELGLDYEVQPVNTRAGDNKQPDFLAVNPAGFIPALTTPEGEHLHESAAIMLYLGERHGEGRLVPGVQDPDRGRFLSLYFFLPNDIQPPTKRFFYPHRYSVTPESVPQIRAQARAAAEERWRVLDGILARSPGPFHLGERFSLADIQLAHWAAYGFDRIEDIVEGFPAVRRVFDAVAARPRCGALLKRQRDSLEAYRAGLKQL